MNTKPVIAPRRQDGLTLIELLVAMAIGLVVTLAITSSVIVGEAHRRTTTAANDMEQTAAYTTYVLDRFLRSAGSGFAQSWNLGVFGCRLSAARGGAVILPRTGTAFPAPFTGFLGGSGPASSGSLAVAPLLIGKNQSDAGSDVLVVMGGGGNAGDISRPIRTPGGLTPSDAVRLDNSIGLTGGDLALISQIGTSDCLIEQIAPFAQVTGNQTLPFGGTTYFTASGATTSFSTLRSSDAAYVTVLGNASAGNAQFQLIGVGANRTLFGYDLLRGDGTDAPQALADGVGELHAVYGLDTNGDGILDTWAAPDDPGYSIATLMATPATLRQIVAVRVALVMRTTNYEKATVASPSLTIFGDLTNGAGTSLKQTIDLTGTADYPHYRYQVAEFTVPLRNMLLP